MKDVTELLKRVKALELTARRNVTSLVAGDYVTTVRGRGMTFCEARKYVPGDDTRLIDWNMTARSGEPWVRVHLDEREREVFVALDVSPSMRTGWQEKTKLEYAVELAATLAVSAVETKDRLGYVLFAREVEAFARPVRGRRRLFETLRALLGALDAPSKPCGESDPRAAVHAVQKLKGKRFAVFLISDFIDHDIPDDFRYVQARHDVSLLHVYDPLEYADLPELRFPAHAPEGPRHDAPCGPGCAGPLEAMQAFLRDTAERYRMRVASLSVREPVDRALRRFLHLNLPRVV